MYPAHLIQNRLAEVEPELNTATQTEHGRIYEILAELTNEDGALTELEDLENLFDQDYLDL